MTQPIRFLFDECLSKTVVETQVARSLALYCGSAAAAVHFLGKYPAGTKDRDWIPEISKEPGWIIVSSDRGTHSKVSERLPLICQAFCVTHVLLSRGLEKRSMYYRALAMESCWPSLITAASQPAGTGFSLRMRELASGTSFSLLKVTDAILIDDAPKVQKRLSGQWNG